MRLTKTSVRGLTSLTDIVTVDLERLGPGLVAFVGKTGAGKSSLMESTPVALWKAFPTRIGFYENFNGQDAFIEAVLRDRDHDLKVRLAVNAVKKTTEGYVFLDDEPVTDGKAGPFKAEIAERFGSMALFLAGPFASQKKNGSFLVLPKAERKDLFIELLGLGALQLLSEDARGHRTVIETALLSSRVRIRDLATQIDAMADAQTVFENAETAADFQRDAVGLARDKEAAANAAADAAASLAVKREPLALAVDAARAEAATAARLLDDAHELEDKAQDRRTERIRFLEARGVDKLHAIADKRWSETNARYEKEAEGVQLKIAALPDLADAEHQKAEAIAAKDERDRTVEVAKRAAQAKKDADRDVAEASKLLELQRAGKKSLLDRLEKQSERLTQVPCTQAPHWWPPDVLDVITKEVDLAGACPLLADARTAAAQIETVKAQPIDEAPLTAAQSAAATAAAAWEPFAALDLLPDPKYQKSIDAAAELVAQANGGVALHERLAQIRSALEANNANRQIDYAHADKAIEDAKLESESIEQEYKAGVEAAGSAVAAATQRLDIARAALAAAETALAAAEAADTVAAELARTQARREREAEEFSLRELDKACAAAQAALDRLAAVKAELATAQDAIAIREEDLGDWLLLERALGRDGVQALEIDASGPEVAKIANDLLAACYGPRFSLTLETQAEKNDGGMKEVFNVRVFDGGAERAVENISGGEAVIVGEALGLAIAIFNARKNDIKWETLWRDETAGALDPVSAQAYVVMLRRARELGGFHQVLFVSHQVEVWEAADAIIRVEDGTAYVQGEAAA